MLVMIYDNRMLIFYFFSLSLSVKFQSEKCNQMYTLKILLKYILNETNVNIHCRNYVHN